MGKRSVLIKVAVRLSLMMPVTLVTDFDLVQNSHDKYLLAHLSRRLIGELVVYPLPGVRSHFQRSSPPKPLGQSKTNFMWSFLGRGNESLFAASGSHALIW